MSVSSTTAISVVDKGIIDYEPCWRAMQNQAKAIAQSHEHQLWLASHPSIYTLGQAGKSEHLLSVDSAEVIQTDRGGQVTWHGPGQIVCYPLLHLPSLGIGPKQLVHILEQTLIQVLASFHVQASTQVGAPGVYVGKAKIASLGLRIHRSVSYHGLALNHSNDLEPFLRINPCGYKGLAVTRCIDHCAVGIEECTQSLLYQLLHNLTVTN